MGVVMVVVLGQPSAGESVISGALPWAMSCLSDCPSIVLDVFREFILRNVTAKFLGKYLDCISY